MASYTLFRVADGGKINFLIPAKEQVQIGEDLVLLGEGEVQTKGFEEVAKSVFIDHAGIVEGPGSGCKRGNTQDPWECFTWNIGGAELPMEGQDGFTHRHKGPGGSVVVFRRCTPQQTSTTQVTTPALGVPPLLNQEGSSNGTPLLKRGGVARSATGWSCVMFHVKHSGRSRGVVLSTPGSAPQGSW